MMKQLYDCRYDSQSDFGHCPTNEICAAREAGLFVEYTIDKTYTNYFDNWFNQMDLMCVPPSKYMTLGSVFYFSAGISGVLLSSFAELHGRKKTIVLFQLISSGAQLLILLTPNYVIRLICFALLGLSQNLKNG
jgi:MFS family permease